MIKVKVTQDHINKGYRGMCELCPIALALKDTFGKFVGVGLNSWFFSSLPLAKRYRLPEIASDFISRYDYNQTVTPFEFELEIPPEITI